ncbi:MAG TPA: hypothetical protein VIO33_07675, partial [Burkholderiaceae bacterium]
MLRPLSRRDKPAWATDVFDEMRTRDFALIYRHGKSGLPDRGHDDARGHESSTVTKPKIAIAMYGIPRGSAITLPSLQRHFIEPAQQLGECRVFYHLYR